MVVPPQFGETPCKRKMQAKMKSMDHLPADLDEMIAREKKLVAIEYHNEAWADGVSEGIETEILAEAALTTALTELMREAGEDCALELIEKMREQIIAGSLLPERTLQ